MSILTKIFGLGKYQRDKEGSKKQKDIKIKKSREQKEHKNLSGNKNLTFGE